MGDAQSDDVLSDLLAFLDGDGDSHELESLVVRSVDSLGFAPDASTTILSPLGDATLDFCDESQLLHEPGFPDTEGLLATSTLSIDECSRAESLRTCEQHPDPTVSIYAKYDIKSRKDPNKARNERAQEIRTLRVEVKELTAQLSTIQGVSGGSKRSVLCQATEAGESQRLVRVPALWESICRNQLARRVRSERENVRLKRAIEEQVRLANAMERAIKRPAIALKNAEYADLCSSKRVYSLPSESDSDTDRFDMLLEEVNASKSEVDCIFALNGIAERQPEPLNGSHMRDGKRGRFVDMFSSSLLPFPLADTADVVWQFYSGPSKHRGPLYYKTAQKLESSEDTIMEKFAIELCANNVRADFRVWQVMRRYVEVDRVTVVWMGVIEPIEFANKSFSSCAFREKGYVVCRPASTVPGESPTADSNFTQLQRCHRIVPYTTQRKETMLTATDKREIGAVIDFVLNLDSISVHLEKFEDELVRRSLQK